VFFILCTEMKRVVTQVFPAMILRLDDMLNGSMLSVDNESNVRDMAMESVRLATVIATTAADDDNEDGAPAEKRQRTDDTTHVPSNPVLVDEVYIFYLLRNVMCSTIL